MCVIGVISAVVVNDEESWVDVHYLQSLLFEPASRKDGPSQQLVYHDPEPDGVLKFYFSPAAAIVVREQQPCSEFKECGTATSPRGENERTNK